jgi:hypothetical protein
MPTSFTNPIPGRSPLGQDTGQTDARKSQEARKILSMLKGCDLSILTEWEAIFLISMRFKEQSKSYMFSGKEVGHLRDIKDKYASSGLL